MRTLTTPITNTVFARQSTTTSTTKEELFLKIIFFAMSVHFKILLSY
jgi:hypothetical protein